LHFYGALAHRLWRPTVALESCLTDPITEPGLTD